MATTAKARPKKVQATYKMDLATFVKHFNARHHDSLAGMKGLPENLAFEEEQSYRAFHNRLHTTRVDLEHEHSPDPPEGAVAWALYCLTTNHARGWHEIAGTDGVVSCFPDGRYATRIRGVTKHHDTADEAAIRLLEGD
jgi:hypothetical protein